MQYVTDLHLHSKYSRAVSQSMILPTIRDVAKQKGINIVSITDFTHPAWLKEVESLVEESGEGVYTLSSDPDDNPVRFIVTTEIACIYKDRNKLRRIHALLFVPSIAHAWKVQKELIRRGANISSDGRPIIGLSVKELLEVVMELNDTSLLIPAHIWTPHFGLLGSASGYDSIEEAFGELAPFIYGIETGLSSDPSMNWEVKELANRSLLSFSDAHSMSKMGRELTVMELEKADYPSIRKAIMQPSLNEVKRDTRDKRAKEGNDPSLSSRIVYTLEFYPEEGKYHYSGHRDCRVVLSPEEVAKKGIICPVCHRRLTEGVMSRVQQLSEDFHPRESEMVNEQGLRWLIDPEKIHPPSIKMVPLLEIVAESLGFGVGSKKVTAQYLQMIEELGNEMTILLKTPIDTIKNCFGVRLAEGVAKVRNGDIGIYPGFDNQYGVVTIWPDKNSSPHDSSQMSLL